MVTRIIELEDPRFTWEETQKLMKKQPIDLFGVTVENRAACKWFRFDAPDVQSLDRVIGILTT